MKKIVLLISLFLFSALNVHAAQNCFTKKNYLAARTPELVVTANNLAAQKNFTALKKMIDSRLVYILRDKIPVQIKAMDKTKKKIKISFISVKLTVWTSKEAVECKKSIR
jgi:hypothetical protein